MPDSYEVSIRIHNINKIQPYTNGQRYMVYDEERQEWTFAKWYENKGYFKDKFRIVKVTYWAPTLPPIRENHGW